MSINLWSNAEHSLGYLQRADSIPHRREGEAALLEFLPAKSSASSTSAAVAGVS